MKGRGADIEFPGQIKRCGVHISLVPMAACYNL